MESLFCCPVCGRLLTVAEHAYLCPQGHSFDRAAKGYVNLLLPNQKNSPEPGDDADCLRARQRLLASGAYAPLARALGELAVRLCGTIPAPKMVPAPKLVLDCCCGEGYYTRALAAALHEAEIPARMAGFDISRTGVRMASSRAAQTEYAVASIFRIPAEDSSIDLALHCFAPYCDEELARVVRPGGVVLSVSPGRRHLFAMKQVLYAQPYENDEAGAPAKRLAEEERVHVTGCVTLTPQATADLFAMTPYFYRTDPAAAQRLRALPQLETEIDFLIQVLRRPVDESRS